MMKISYWHLYFFSFIFSTLWNEKDKEGDNSNDENTMKKKLQTILIKEQICLILQYQKTPKSCIYQDWVLSILIKKYIEYLKNFHMNQIKHCKFWCFNQETLTDIILLQLYLQYQNYIQLIHLKIKNEVNWK